MFNAFEYLEEKKQAQISHYSTVELPYFISLSAIHAYWGKGRMGRVGSGVGIDNFLITLELFYSTKQIQRVAVSPHRTTKVINRAVNKQTGRQKKKQKGKK